VDADIFVVASIVGLVVAAHVHAVASLAFLDIYGATGLMFAGAPVYTAINMLLAYLTFGSAEQIALWKVDWL